MSHHKKNAKKTRNKGVKKEVKVKKESTAASDAVRFPVLNKQQHGLTDLANDETPISGQDKKNDTTKKQQEPPERAEEEEPVEKQV